MPDGAIATDCKHSLVGGEDFLPLLPRTLFLLLLFFCGEFPGFCFILPEMLVPGAHTRRHCTPLKCEVISEYLTSTPDE